ncbi:GNAT family N-acetyltransferase [Longispora albida]|uniref:GNAT family N-acetyltransferase n=1 Tax=Longispora albida TaxID=203523 RepID=UPI000380658E|nr:GNAT family N-acetyltransferase [Longispora albida]
MIILRPLRESDADDLALACNDPLIQRFVPTLPAPYQRDHALWWITQGAPTVEAHGGQVWAIADPATDRLLGSVAVQPGTLGYWVAPWARRRGVATEAAKQGAAWAFARGQHRVELMTRAENHASQRVALAAGFRPEGTRRAAERDRDGVWHDMLIWSRLPGDPPGPVGRLIPDLPGGELTDGVVTLRPAGPEHADDLFGLWTLPDVVATSVPPEVPSREEVARRCELAPAMWLTGNSVDLVILDAATGGFAGEISLFYQEPPTGQAMIGYSAWPAFRGRGYTTRAANLIAEWAFKHVGVKRLIAGTNPSNAGSQKVLERAGFNREGYQHSRLPGAEGTRIDDILWARLP